MSNPLKTLYIRFTGYSYTHLGRMFLRMFVGVMLIQFGLRQLVNFEEAAAMVPTIWGIEGATTLAVAIAVELLCSFCIMIGFITRLMVLPPFIMMIIAECYIANNGGLPGETLAGGMYSYVPMFFLGIYFFILLVGPGKISCDYFLSLHFLHSEDQSETELEEV